MGIIRRQIGRIGRHVGSNLVAYVALFFALSGSAAYAANTIFSADIVDGQVFSVDVADNNLSGVDILNSSLTGADIGFNTLTGSDVADSSLTGADVGFNTLTGSDIAENTLSVAAMGCQTGKVLGFARVKGSGSMPSFYTTSSTYIDITNNCAGYQVQVRRVSTGLYHVKFVGNPAALALASPNADGAGVNSIYNDNIITVAREFSSLEGYYFRVEVEDSCGDCSGGTDPQDSHFTMLLP
jgi:hypothetical protein